MSVGVSFLIAAAAVDKPLATALWLGVFSGIGGTIVLAVAGLSRNPKLWSIGLKMIFVAAILWGVVMLYIFGWFFLHLQ